MWRFTPADGEQSAEQLKTVASRLQVAASDVPKFLKLLVKSPASTSAYLQASQALENGLLDACQREAIALTVAAINGSAYCLALHEAAGRKAGLSEEDIRLARKASAKEPKAESMLRFVQSLVLQRGEISDPDFQAVRKAGVSEAEIMEVLANVAVNIFTNYFNLLAQTGSETNPFGPARPSTT